MSHQGHSPFHPLLGYTLEGILQRMELRKLSGRTWGKHGKVLDAPGNSNNVTIMTLTVGQAP